MPISDAEKLAIQGVVSDLTSTTAGTGKKRRDVAELFMDLVDPDAWAEYYEVRLV
jgi:chromatin structure-remodeling complex subunit RSC1/2